MEELTIEKGLKKCVSLPRILLLIILAVCLWDGMRFEKHFQGIDGDGRGTAATQSTSQQSSNQLLETAEDVRPHHQIELIFRNGIIRVNGAWSRHPIISAISYFFVHEGLVTMIIALILLGKRREPSRAQMSASYWAGLGMGLMAWTAFWGYQRWYWYFLVFIASTFFMSVVSRYTASGRAVLKLHRVTILAL